MIFQAVGQGVSSTKPSVTRKALTSLELTAQDGRISGSGTDEAGIYADVSGVVQGTTVKIAIAPIDRRGLVILTGTVDSNNRLMDGKFSITGGKGNWILRRTA